MYSKLDIYCIVNYTIYAKHALQRGVKMKSRIQAYRKAKRISQEELALAVGVTRQTITSLEGEKYMASLTLAYRIAKYFNTTIEDLFVFDDSED